MKIYNPNAKPPTEEEKKRMSEMMTRTPESDARYKKNVAEWEAMTPAQQEARLAEGRAKMMMQNVQTADIRFGTAGVRRSDGKMPTHDKNGPIMDSGIQNLLNIGATQVGPEQHYFNQDFGGIARAAAQSALAKVQLNGTAKLNKEKKEQTVKSELMNFLEGPDDPEEDLPIGPGFAMMTHLFKRAGGMDKIRARHKEKFLNGANLITNSMDAAKNAMKMIGIFSDQNSNGLPFDINDAMKAFFGKDEPDDIQKSQFQHDIMDGTSKIDKKKVRKFVNNDGSLTWEVLNDDKSVMSRFTFGEYNGHKIFAQGGYKGFAELLEKAKKQLGPDKGAEFDAIRSNYKR